MLKKFSENKLSATSFVLGAVFCVSPWSSSATALLLGIVLSIFIGNPFIDTTKTISQKLLSYSIIGLGAGMNLITVGQAGLSGLTYTIISISLTLILGIILGKLMKSDGETSVLISVGTAICGGSAIAAVAPAIKAKSQSITVALGTVFLLNAVALIIFPFIGHHLILTQEQFGLWSALAIHDTSSVVGAGLQYGPEALKIGTTVKLARALWIVPLTFLISYLNRKKNSHETTNTKKPWFILGFLIMAAIFTWLPQLKNLGHNIELVARKGFILTLFFIGTNLSWNAIKTVGLRPLAQGLLLWLIVSATTLLFIIQF
jgi:uncharacterized integral membrane protein (TIGR00698 family)